MIVRAALKTATAWAVSRTGFDRRAQHRLHRNVPFIVGYHRVVERMNEVKGALPSMEITVAMLEQHLDWLSRHFRIVSLDQMCTGEDTRTPTAAITFDDGYSDVYHHAFPLLKRKGIPAGVFVVTDIVGTNDLPIHERLYAALARSGAKNPFSTTQLLLQRLPQSEVRRIIREAGDAETHSEALLPMTWDMLLEMRTAGMTIGSHSRTHAFLTNETEDRVREEVEGSRVVLQRKFNASIDWFAYPGGSFNPLVVRAVAKAGYRYALSDCRRHRDARHPLLTLPRKGLWEQSCLDPRGRFSPSIMSCHAAAMFDRFSQCDAH
jgi:peptidoglycan/xylan/chitin deacetylase (PgdA/CDA1 family)